MIAVDAENIPCFLEDKHSPFTQCFCHLFETVAGMCRQHPVQIYVQVPPGFWGYCSGLYLRNAYSDKSGGVRPGDRRGQSPRPAMRSLKKSDGLRSRERGGQSPRPTIRSVKKSGGLTSGDRVGQIPGPKMRSPKKSDGVRSGDRGGQSTWPTMLSPEKILPESRCCVRSTGGSPVLLKAANSFNLL